MQAVIFHGVGDIRVERVDDPQLQQPLDAIVRLTASAICGTDLHMIRGTLPGMRPGTILGEGTDNQITALFEQRVVLGLAGVEVPFVFVWDRDVAEVVARGVVERVTGTFNVAGDGVVTLADVARIEGKRRVAVPAGLVESSLRGLSRFRLAPYGPEQVDFLRYRPVLANDRLKRAFPGLPTKSSREAYEVYRQGRHARA